MELSTLQQHTLRIFLSVVGRYPSVYRNGTIWQKQYLLVKDALRCFILFVFLHVVLKNGAFKPGDRFLAKFKRVLWLRALSCPLLMNRPFFFFQPLTRTPLRILMMGECSWYYAIIFLHRWRCVALSVGIFLLGRCGNVSLLLHLWI